MILGFANGTPEQMTTSLMESVQRALENRDRKLSSIEQDLGQAMNWPHIEFGTVSGVSVPKNSYADIEVEFDTEFETVPVVVACFYSTSVASTFGNSTMSVHDITQTGFTIRMFHGEDSANRNPGYRWIAVEMTKGPKLIRGPAGPQGPRGFPGEVVEGGGGGGGTSDYTELTNKPQINSTTLSGNKSSSSLGLADAVHTHVIEDIPDLETVTQLRDGLMTALDKQKLDGIASGAEVNVQSDWNQATNTADDFIKNKPTIPSKVSDLTNDAGYITGYTETDPVFSASVAAGITSSDISSWDDKSKVSLTRYTSSGTNIADITIDGTTTKLYAPTSGGGGVTDYDQLSSRPQINSTTLTGNKSSADLGLAAASHSHVKADITDFPAIPSNTSDLNNDSGFLTSETDPTVPSWAKQPSKPGYTASEISGLIDMFYPIGSYYETSDTSFDPNVEWSGTWVLESGGLVHVSAGTGYTAGDTGGEAEHTLTTSEMPSHTHIQDRHRHSAPNSSYDAFMVYNFTSLGEVGLSETRVSQATSGSRYAVSCNNASFDATYTRYVAYDTPTNQNTGGGDSHNNMQPYVVVNRWHRTA